MKNLDERTTCFVYGTLMKGFGNERVIANFPHENVPARISGVEMFDVGGFPALVAGESAYDGELLVFGEEFDHDTIFGNMDRLEGYREDLPEERSMYLRRPVVVTLEDGTNVETVVYLWNRGTGGLRPIPADQFTGYREYLQAKGESRVW